MAIPKELRKDIEAFSDRWEEATLRDWLTTLPHQLTANMAESRFGDLPRWRASLASLPELNAETIELNAPSQFGFSQHAYF